VLRSYVSNLAADIHGLRNQI